MKGHDYYKHEDYTEQYYLKQVKQYESKNTFHKFRMRHVYKLNPPKKGEVVVDLGCGMGTFAIEASKHGCEVLAIDMSPIAIKHAKALFKKYGKGKGRFVVGSCDTIPMKNNSVDKVYMGGVIEHIPDDVFAKTLDEIHRVLKKGGYFLFECPAPHHLLEKFEELGLFVEKDHTHIGLKDEKLIKEYFTKHGFKIINFLQLPTHLSIANPVEKAFMMLPLVGKYFVRRYAGMIQKI